MPKAIDTLELDSRVGPAKTAIGEQPTRAVLGLKHVSSLQPIGFVFFPFLLRQGLRKPGLPSNS